MVLAREVNVAIDIHKEVLVRSDADFVQQFEYMFHKRSIEHVEGFLGVEFPYSNGVYQSDLSGMNLSDEEFERIESLDVDKNTFRKKEDNIFPTSYPCVLCIYHEQDADRVGDFEIFNLHIVYPSHFEAVV